MTDLLLVHPGSRAIVYQGLGAELSAVATPVWAGMIATLARDVGLGVSILDCEARNLSAADAAKEALAATGGKGLVAVVIYGHQPSASTQNMTYAGALAREIKALDQGQQIMFLGGHIATLPERALREEVC
ncbi:MAG: cobalamin-dependent protein, partial [Dehalococcoidia bacterium]|nr:cobalamin-dependent protein [Dehalococcoidia bacterium]